ncbi:MAG: CutC family protein [Flavipsychrobacter sp.]|jgi:copper homeostasis protein|nr:CutC family protein [Flavipsychrobacter sp.]
MLLEICAYNIQSCLTAQKAGASRIELCADPDVGGTTPSYGLIRYAIEKLSIPIFPMIRPRGGNFVYDEDELAIMKQDILMCRELGCPGIATGVLLANGRIDVPNLTRLVEWAHPMAVTCHKAFDRTIDAAQALEDVIAAGCSRVLTSGLCAIAFEGATVLAQLMQQASNRIIIMPGGGVRSSNIAKLVRATNAAEYHSSGIVQKSESYLADGEEIRMMVEALTKYELKN